MAQPVGICALCHQEKLLEDSHLIPAWAYRYLYKAVNDEPIHVAGGTAMHKGKQIKQYLLCRCCEQRFSTREDYVSKLVKEKEDGNISLTDNLTRISSPIGLAIVDSGVDVEKIIYFSISILWRMALMKDTLENSSKGKNFFQIARYQEVFRRYLLGEISLPVNVALHLIVLEASSTVRAPSHLATFPTSARHRSNWVHGFIICGLSFRCYIGDNFDDAIKKPCLIRNSEKVAYPLPAEKVMDFRNAAMAAKEATPRGRLAVNRV